MPWSIIWIFIIVSAVCCAVGFKKFVYFLSIGYGFSVVGLGIAYLVYSLINDSFNVFIALETLLFAIYGLRLSVFLLIREIKSASYKKVFDEVSKTGEKPMPVFVKATIWVVVSLLYVAQTSPVLFRAYNNNTSDIVLPIIGIVISALGILIESLADKQKSAQKKENSNMVATKGLYKFMRCPNYFGEILFWTGVVVGGITIYNSVGQWICAFVGYVLIVYIMINGAQRLDKRQEKRYGNDETYRKYADHTPIIVPFIPVSHIGKYKEEVKKGE